MRILLVNHFPLEGSGSGTYVKNIALHLRKRGHSVYVISPENRSPREFSGIVHLPVMFSKGRTHPDALPFNFPCFTTHPQSATTFADLSAGELSQYLTVFAAVLRRAVQTFQPDIIHAQHLWCLSWLASLYGVPSVVTIHGTDLMGYEKWPAFRGFAEEAAVGSKCVLAISRDIHDRTLSLMPQTFDKMRLLTNGYNEDIFYPEEIDRTELLASMGLPYCGENIVLFVGKLTAFKGVGTLLRAAHCYERLAEDEILTLIVGDGKEREQLEMLSRCLNLKKTRFLGHKSQDELRRLYNAADVFVMPSRREPFGLVALEAMACGLPVVASNEGGMPEFVSREAGTLVSVDDVEAFCGAILEELTRRHVEPERRAAIARYARCNFAQQSYVERLEEVYEAALSPKRLKEECAR